MGAADDGEQERPTMLQRMALRRIRRAAGRSEGEPLAAEDWAVLWALEHSRSNRMLHGVWRAVPSPSRCRMCAAPFEGIGRLATRPLGFRPSRKNPHICSVCVELSPPGGTTMATGVLFADLRDFTRSAADTDPETVSRTLRRFYGCAEKAFFPEALIDKLIGDEVMAIYLRPLLPDVDITALMVDHARDLLAAVGYGTSDGPFVEVGIGIDFGEAFVGNIGQRAVYDFTAVGDVVNMASRLQGEAAGGEVVVAERALGADPGFGERTTVSLKGKDEPVPARRFRPFG